MKRKKRRFLKPQLQRAWVAVPAGTDYKIPFGKYGNYSLEGVVEIFMGESINMQLMAVPDGVTLAAWTPDDMDPVLAENFRTIINVSWLGVSGNRVTHAALLDIWYENALKNFHHLTKCKPVDQLPKRPGTKRAIIIGNGPSLKAGLEKLKTLDLSDSAVFTTWHSLHKLLAAGIKTDYVCHSCFEAPPFDFKNVAPPFSTIFIAETKAAPDFVEVSKFYETYTYLTRDLPITGFLAKEMGCVEHENIRSTVVSMLLNCADYAGYDEFVFVGVDNGWPEGEPDYPGVTNPVEVINKHGIKMKTFSVFAMAALGLENIILSKNLKVYQTTKNALDISGTEYKPLEEVLNG